uniref:Uncharacterized protein n=1 Tax=Arundo donax TaxID=35708 RepID=A0A0A8Z592_ARUDO
MILLYHFFFGLKLMFDSCGVLIVRIMVY